MAVRQVPVVEVILVTMSIGEYAGVPLQDSDETWRNGAVFFLRRPPHWSDSVSIGGWTTSVVANVPAVVACGPMNARNFDDTFAAALTAANRGLDYMSVTGMGDHAIRDPFDDCLVWWPDDARGGIVLRCRMIQNAELPARSNATGTVTNPDGTVPPSPPPQSPMVREAYRFIRMARTSDDLYDSYRNMFLGFECLLSDIRPPQRITTRRGCGWLQWGPAKTKWESESQWFKAALIEADRLVSVNHLTGPGDHTNHVKWVMNHMYDRERSALMHAKQRRDREYLLPQDHIPREELTASLGRLWSYIQNLVRVHYGVTGRMFDISAHVIGIGALKVLRESVVVVSDDESPVGNVLAPAPLIAEGSRIVELQSGDPSADPDQPRLWTVTAHCDPSNLRVLSGIRKLGASLNNEPAHVVSELYGPLHLGESVVRFEVVHGLRYVNPVLAPSHFSS